VPVAVDEDRRQVGLHQREHEAAERAHRREHDADSRSIELAMQGINRRLEELNQLRKEVIIDRNQFVVASTYAAEHQAVKVEFRGKSEALAARIDALEKVIDRFEGSVNTWRAIAGFLGVTGVGAIIYAIANGKP
jgi:hypothetical protein